MIYKKKYLIVLSAIKVIKITHIGLSQYNTLEILPEKKLKQKPKRNRIVMIMRCKICGDFR